MTRREHDLITFLRRWFAEHEHSPSYAEIAAGLGLASKQSVHRLIHQAVAKGLVSIDPHRARSLRLVNGESELRAAAKQLIYNVVAVRAGAGTTVVRTHDLDALDIALALQEQLVLAGDEL